jgi:uncharacterized membrane protein YoaK (UPF0700 family)
MSANCDYFFINTIQYYATSVVDPCGIIFNFVCIVCFGQILWHKSESNQTRTSNLFKYLLIKAACDFVALSIEAFSALLMGNFAFYNGSLSSNIYYIYFNRDIVQILYMVSALMEVVATLGMSFKSSQVLQLN